MLELQEILNTISKKHVYIQTHNFPDPDALSSAYGMKRLLEYNGISATICYKGKIDRYAMLKFIEYLDIEIENVSDMDYLTAEDEIILVDSQKGNANIIDIVGAEIICIDHHPTFEQVNYQFSDIRPEVGACASIIASYFFENAIPIDEKTATAFMYGIKIDTANLTRGVSKLDLDMFYKLFWLSNQMVLGQLERSEIQFNDLKAYANAISNIKVFDNVSIAYTGMDCPEPLIASISDFMLALSEIDCSIVYSLRKEGIKLSVRSCVGYIDSGKLAKLALKDIGSGGGHVSMAGGFAPYPKNMENVEPFIQEIEARFMDELYKMEKLK